MNRKYGKLTGGEFAYAPSTLFTPMGVITNPTRASYLAAGWKTVIDEPPTPPEGKTAALSGYTETDETITAVYKFVPLVIPPRTFSKLKVVAALQAKGIWEPVRDWLEETGFYDLFLAAQDFREDHPSFTTALTAAKARFGLTDDEVVALLSGRRDWIRRWPIPIPIRRPNGNGNTTARWWRTRQNGRAAAPNLPPASAPSMRHVRRTRSPAAST